MLTILLLVVVLTVVNVEGIANCSHKIDLLVVLDGSNSICGANSCPDWDRNLQFVKSIVANLNIGPDATRVALVTMSSQGNLQWNFDTYHDKDSLMSAIGKVSYPAGAEMVTIASFANMMTSFIKASMAQRSDAIVVAIAISDGAPYLQNPLSITASNAVQAIGVNVCTICVTNRCPADLAKSVSSPPRMINETYFWVKDYSSLGNIRDNLLKQICAFKGTNIVDSIIGGITGFFG